MTSSTDASKNPFHALTQVFNTVRLVWELMADPRVPAWPKVVPPAVLLYVLSPIDLIPDFLVGLGQLDDIAVTVLGLNWFIGLCPPYIVDEHRRRLGMSTHSGPEDIVEAEYRVVDDARGR